MKRIPYLLLIAALLILASPPSPAAATEICIAYPSVLIPVEIAPPIYDYFRNTAVGLPIYDCYAVTDISSYAGNKWLISVAGLTGQDGPLWNLDDNLAWMSVLALEPDGDNWRAAMQGSLLFSEMIHSYPLDQAAIDELDTYIGDMGSTSDDPPLLADSGGYSFPFLDGRYVQYGGSGVHGTGENNRWAVDFISWSESMMAPDSVYAAASGAVTYVCRDDVGQMGLRIGGLYYAHLNDDPNVVVGSYFSKHDWIGTLKHGTFDGDCGYAEQQWNHWHLHLTFSPTNNSLTMESWVLNINTQKWTYGTDTRSPGQLIGPADWNGYIPPPPPVNYATPTPGPSPTPGPTPTPGPEPPSHPPNPGEGNNRTNFWTFLVNAASRLVDRVVSALPQHESINLAVTIGTYAALPIKVFYMFGLLNFAPAFLLAAIILFLELIRLIYAAWMWIKRAIPFVG